MFAITAEALRKDFGRIRAVDDVTFEVQPGHVVGLLGPNGSGKTTLLRMLLGLVAPTGGRALIGGRRFADLDDPARQVGAVLEADGCHPGRTARDHLRVRAIEAGLSYRRVDGVLELVGLADAADHAAALLGDPGVLILDEPTNGLDLAGIRWLRGGAVMGAAGALVGTATHSPTIATGAFFAWNFVESVLIPTGIRPYLPYGLVNSLMGGAGGTPGPAAIGLLLGFLAAGALIVRQWALPRDLT